MLYWKTLLAVVACVLFTYFATAGLAADPVPVPDPVWAPNPLRAPLRFSADGKFKIVQFTDTHLNRGAINDPKTPAQLKKAMEDARTEARLIEEMGNILEIEKPDLVILTGDNVFTSSLAEGWRRLAAPMIERKIPWAVVWGNHDHEVAPTKKKTEELMDLLGAMPYAISQYGPRDFESADDRFSQRVGNYVLGIYSPKTGKAAAALYLMDSGAYSTLATRPNETLYSWFTFEQVQWFRQQSQALAAGNGGTPLPSLAFFHIPLPEYDDAFAWGKKSKTFFGRKREAVCCSPISSGMFAAMLESKSVLGCFCGHDHLNDCAACLYGICLAYGRKTGEFADNGQDTGARVIALEEDHRSFSTWLRTGKGAEETRIQYPDTFVPASPTAKAPAATTPAQ